MEFIYEDEMLAVTVVQAIQSGDIPSLKRLLAENQGLATTRIIERDNSNEGSRVSRTLLHVATDWPGHFPNGSAAVAVLVEFGADVNARFTGPHTETPLHWAASCDDIEVLDALLDAGADIEAPGAVIAGGTPLDDAVAFAQWCAARRLVERGAMVALWHAAALGQLDAIKACFAGNMLSERYPWGANSSSPPNKVTVAFWCACHGGQRQTAEYLLQQGAELNWISVWDGLTPLDAAKRSSAAELMQWLASQGAKSASEPG
ncbi:ankyrin repeat domain-containing protein [Paenibacillus oenotherae]|uniref:Ankyrin repeat domain-containing protein n=1 Tax=Paenibacillus oenotherae TaxID=1435645 RepID=A0ABS7D6J5_9BACL|nr:ankyrin repeat domain-containing protein [Paenibacillus oenotherae]MBW7475563.1 ankyrin repeat domain-containing protein [Paenibacillus oenotherae]